MAFQTDKADLGACQHSRIGGAMRFMTRRAALEPHGGVLKRKWPALVAVAFETSGIVGREGLLHGRAGAAMWIVAVHAAHGAFGQFVMERPLKLGPHVQVAGPALVDDCVRLANYERLIARMHFVARSAGNLIPGVTALQMPGLRRLIQMTSEAELIGGRRL